MNFSFIETDSDSVADSAVAVVGVAVVGTAVDTASVEEVHRLQIAAAEKHPDKFLDKSLDTVSSKTVVADHSHMETG